MPRLRRLLGFALLGSTLAVAGCTSGTLCGAEEMCRGDGDADGDGQGGGGEQVTEDQTITDTYQLTGPTTIPAGVSFTFAAGSALVAAEGASLTVEGTLVVEGTADAPVALNPVAGATGWTGITVAAGGSATLRYATGARVATLLNCQTGALACSLERGEFTDIGKVMVTAAPARIAESTILDMLNGGVSTLAGADLTIVDTVLYNSQHDIVVAGGGRLTIEYSEIGAAVGGYDHCNFHIGAADALSIRYTDIPDGIYAFMIGGVTDADITFNNFTGNGTDIDQIGALTAADFSNNYWSNGAPVFSPTSAQASFDVSSPAAAPIAEAGPRI